ncbi:Hypothetical predicted protein [Cloeon dipterum]|uniref:Uncharacterized protein n=1 Tax=Cloeon dipterum TaxID=197152 RepID=A0A8S1DW74_9INSE|nr:Hypothetical predicted protein [Cloeon dipterum]
MERDTVLTALEALPEDQNAPLPDQLEEYLRAVARTGDSLLPWTSIKPLFQRKLALVLDDFILNPDSQSPDAFDATGMRTRLLQRLDSFDTCPFTLQRLAELLTTPRQQYNRIDKFMRAVEKNVLVVSGNDPPQVTANGLSEDNGLEAPEHKKPRIEEVEDKLDTETAVKEQNGNHVEDKKDEEEPTKGPEEDGEMKEEASKPEVEPVEPQIETETAEPPKEAAEEPEIAKESETPAPAEPAEEAEQREEHVAVSEDQEMPLVEKEAPLASPEKDLSDEKVSKALETEDVPMEEQS